MADTDPPRPVITAKPVTVKRTQPVATTSPTHPAATPADTNYTRTGPGPIAAIRTRWTARPVGSITFVVDEVMGENGTPMTSRPMSREAAIKLIDERAQAAHERYALLRSELAWPTEDAAEPTVAMPPVPPPVD
ncbi:MAG: hypothetical protein ACTHNN_04850 [Xanthobacteraceae bacterium]